MSILSGIQNLWDDAGPLASVHETRFEGDAAFITGYSLRFQNLDANLRAESEFDTVALEIGAQSRPEAGSTSIDVSLHPPWPEAIGEELAWAWQLTNQQGYVDGLRLQFSSRPQPTIIELVVFASQFQIYVPSPPPRTAA